MYLKYLGWIDAVLACGRSGARPLHNVDNKKRTALAKKCNFIFVTVPIIVYKSPVQKGFERKRTHEFVTCFPFVAPDDPFATGVDYHLTAWFRRHQMN